jgi:arylsulfatase A-like enzyme
MPHLPLAAPERFRGQSEAERYADVVEMIDWSAGRIMETLEEEGVSENTIVFFASDNGPWLDLPDRMLAGGVKPWHQGTTGPLRGYKHTVWDGGTRVPAIIRWPGHIESGVETGGLAATQDIFVSVVEAVAGPERPAYELDGRNLMPWLTGEAEESPRSSYPFVHRDVVKALRAGPWKLRLVEAPQLYNLEADPAERWNRAEEQPERVEQMRRQVQRLAKRLGTERPDSSARTR